MACACLSEFITPSRAMWKMSSAIGAGSGMSSMSRWYGTPESRPTSSVNDSSASARPLAPSGERWRSRISARMRSDVSCFDSRILSSWSRTGDDLVLVEQLARHVDLDREPEQHLRQIVVQVAGDLQPLVGALLRHRVRQGLQHLLAFLQLLVRLLERLRSEEDLPGEDERRNDGEEHPPLHFYEHDGDRETQNTQSEIANDELPESAEPKLPSNANRRKPELDAHEDRDYPAIHRVIDDGGQHGPKNEDQRVEMVNAGYCME